MSVYGMIGIVGVGFYLGSYAMLQTGILKGAGLTYTILNLIAASCVAISLIDAFNLSSLVIQLSWITISLIGLSRLYLFRCMHRFSLDDRKFGDAALPEIDDQDLHRSSSSAGKRMRTAYLSSSASTSTLARLR